MKIVAFLFCIPFYCFALCDDQCPPQVSTRTVSEVRLKALNKLNQFLDWSISEKQRTYPLRHPIQEKRIKVDIPEVKEFAEKYGYFSPKRPIVAKVTSNEQDMELVCCLLKTLYEKGAKGEYLTIATAEVLTKALAYRDLKAGQIIRIPIETSGAVAYEPFVVDEVFDIWLGMPAFGLIPEKQGLASILLFRGTDVSLDAPRGWASLLSDLDIAGPGLYAFHCSRDQISKWLKKVIQLGKKAKTMGFSLGGALAAYTFIYENPSLTDQGSIAVCSPGVGGKVLKDWRSLPGERQKGLVSYVNTGDIISKVGRMFGTVYCLTTATAYKPITAHTTLICSEPAFTVALVESN